MASAKKPMDKRYVLVALAVCLMACGTMGLPNAYGVFYTPMSEGLGAGRGAITLHMSLSNLAIGIFTPVVAKSLARGHKLRVGLGSYGGRLCLRRDRLVQKQTSAEGIYVRADKDAP